MRVASILNIGDWQYVVRDNDKFAGNFRMSRCLCALYVLFMCLSLELAASRQACPAGSSEPVKARKRVWVWCFTFLTPQGTDTYRTGSFSSR